MKMLTFLCVAVMILACEAVIAPEGERLDEIDITKRDQGPGDDIYLGPCNSDASINAITGGYCDVVKPYDPCVLTEGVCGWGTRRIRYYCGQDTRQECSCEAKCFIPCNPPLSKCPYSYYYDCYVIQHSPCSKTCGVGYKQIEYECREEGSYNSYISYKCLEECCCIPCPGTGIIPPNKVCQGKVVVAVRDRRMCCPFTDFTGRNNDEPISA